MQNVLWSLKKCVDFLAKQIILAFLFKEIRIGVSTMLNSSRFFVVNVFFELGGHQLKIALPVPDEKLDHFDCKKKIRRKK